MPGSSRLEKAIAILEDPETTRKVMDDHYYADRCQGAEQYVAFASTGYEQGIKYALKVMKEQQAKSK